MNSLTKKITSTVDNILNGLGFGMRTKLIIIFLLVKVIPLILLTVIAWRQIIVLGDMLREMAVSDSTEALNDSATENIERMTTDMANRVADFLYSRDTDILYLANIEPTEENYRKFADNQRGILVEKGEWELAPDGQSWVSAETKAPASTGGGISTNGENNDLDGFHYRQPQNFTYESAPLYMEITYIDLNGNELVKTVTSSPTNPGYQMDPQKKNVSRRENTFVKAETYFEELKDLKPGEIYVSDVIGAYVGSNYIGMYTPENVDAAAKDRGYGIEYTPEEQAYAGMENPNGKRFQGIVRWATPVTDENGVITGYVTFALNHDHIMEFVDHLTPMNERYTQLPSAYEGNYAFIWDYKCRNICHPRHHSIVGFDPETGDPQVPWLETSIYEAWQASGIKKWDDFITGVPTFNEQSRNKKPAPALTQAGLVGLDGRYLNNAPQCTGWMDLTQDGGSGSFYILWSGLYKLTTAAAIPYYTGHYAPSEDNGYSLRGFGFVAIGAGLEDFTRPARETEERLVAAIGENLTNTFLQLAVTTTILIILVVLVAIQIASSLTNNITRLINGISRFRAGERQFRFHTTSTDEFGTLADSFDDMADSIVDSVKSPLSITDIDRHIIYMNDAGLEYYEGKTLSEIVGKSYSDISVYPEGSKYCPITALERGTETEILYAEDTDRFIKGTASYFLDKDGKRIGYIILTQDMTQMVRDQIKTEEQNTLLDKVFSSSPDLIWYQDAKGEYLTVNPRFSSIAGKSPDEFVGKTALEMLPSDIAQDFIKKDRQAIASLTPFYTEDQLVFSDGHEETLDSVRTPIIDANKTPLGLLGFARNVTRRVTIENALRNTQLELEQAVKDANRANEHKGEFLARMSHEIRTPMNAIIGITSIVLKRMGEAGNDTPEKTEVRGHVHQIEASSQHLLGLLNDILDISKIEAGKIELSEELMELPKLANIVAGIIRPRCDEKNIKFLTDFDSFSPSAFLSDSLRLRQVLINLLGNAVKFTPECGKVEFQIKKLDRRDGETLVAFSVRDTGIGISEEAMETIFLPFEQGNGNVSRQYGGTGLGLSISNRIVQLFGGEITVNSTVGQGSEFSFSIWLRETVSDLPDKVEISDVTGRFANKRMLLVDDVEINRMIVISMLEETGMLIDEADDGAVAVEKFRDSPENTYDIILMDVQMPNMDGYEASTAIRALDRPDARRVPIITLTANAFKDDIDKALRHGMNAHISKPVEMDPLLETLYRFLSAGD